MISPSTLVAIRTHIDIVSVIEERVPSLKKRGRHFVGLCPFHAEKTPSFHVNPERGLFYCFGCKESGSVIDFLMKQDGYTFREAVYLLAERLGIKVIDETEKTSADVDRKKKYQEDLLAVHHLAATFFEQQLREHPQCRYAWEELKRRNLLPSWARDTIPIEEKGVSEQSNSWVDRTIQAFRIGYAPAGWNELAHFLKAQGISLALCEEAGLVVARSDGGYYDRFRHRLMFPIQDMHGRVIGFSGRLLPSSEWVQNPVGRAPKYINSPESFIYSKRSTLLGLHQARQSIRERGEAILVEGNFDVLSLYAHQLTHVVAPLGSAFTSEQAQLLKRFTSHVVFLFDADAAGQKAVHAARNILLKSGLYGKVACLPSGLDPDEQVRVHGSDAVLECVRRARGMLEYLIETALDETFHSGDAYERAARVERVAQLLAEEDDPLVRNMAKTYADQLAGRLDLARSVDTFRALEQVVKKKLQATKKVQAIKKGGEEIQKFVLGSREGGRIRTHTPGHAERREMVGALLEFPSLLRDEEVQIELDLLEGVSAQVISLLANRLDESSEEVFLDIPYFLTQIPPAIHSFVLKRCTAPCHENSEQAKLCFLENARKLRRFVLSRETLDIARSQRKIEGDWEAEALLAREAEERARLKHGLQSTKKGMR
ncbi:DNA primase [Pajaroellobacter abortibovis]|uniref:DNA primase n=1 Tax=Pajaroellobacter abortibovis TaxID=1882918 RepID=A0A1L6MXF8_9BACT|nr:CHC2 zinc finger domain-containing protein [Pajaroellobacter abortibovis]APS00149.1 hypothetical protein BCY86_05240 [Pajaroellobacter abortibovis]